MTVKEMTDRLRSYPGAHPNGVWKLETDLMKCTEREKERMAVCGLTPEDLMVLGLNRGQVAHILFGYKYS